MTPPVREFPARAMRAEKPLVSCILPAYNYGHMIVGAIESALAQDYGAEHLEIIVIDDGSTDNTPDVVTPYLDRIRYVRKENGGLASSFNRGVAEATGEFLTLLDADDEWTPDKVRRQIEVFDGRPEVGLVYSDLELIDEHGHVTHPSYFAKLGLTPPRGRIFGAELLRNYACGGTLMIRASLKHHFHPIPEWMVCQDWPTVVILSKVCEIEMVDAPLYRYRQHEENMNLGLEGAGRLKLMRRENDLRRWNIMQVEPGDATEQEIVGALMTLDDQSQQLVTGLELTLADLFEVTDADRAAYAGLLARGSAAARAGDRYRAVCLLGRAVATDPTSAEAREWLAAALSIAPSAPAPETLTDVRDFAVLAFADELVSEPGLLSAYDRVFGAEDNATLVIYAPGWDDSRAGEAILGALARAGIDGQSCADLLALAVEQSADHERSLAGRVDAVLSNRVLARPFGERPTFSAGDATNLRTLAERSWLN